MDKLVGVHHGDRKATICIYKKKYYIEYIKKESYRVSINTLFVLLYNPYLLHKEDMIHFLPTLQTKKQRKN